MKYSWEFKLECVENYKIGKSSVKPKYAKCNQREFSHKVREWVRIYELHGIDGLKHKPSNKDWTKEEKFDLVSKVLAGNSIKSIAIEAGIHPGLLHKWVKKYKQEGYNGLELKRRGRPPKENLIMTKPSNDKEIKLTKSELEELKLLRRRNEYLEAENAYLKKARALVIEKMASSAKAKKPKSSKNWSTKKDID